MLCLREFWSVLCKHEFHFSDVTNKKRVSSAHPVQPRDQVDRAGFCSRGEKLEGEELVLALASGLLDVDF